MRLVIEFHILILIGELKKELPKSYRVNRVSQSLFKGNQGIYSMQQDCLVKKSSNIIVCDLVEGLIDTLIKYSDLDKQERKERENIHNKYERLREVYYNQIKAYGD